LAFNGTVSTILAVYIVPSNYVAVKNIEIIERVENVTWRMYQYFRQNDDIVTLCM